MPESLSFSLSLVGLGTECKPSGGKWKIVTEQMSNCPKQTLALKPSDSNNKHKLNNDYIKHLQFIYTTVVDDRGYGERETARPLQPLARDPDTQHEKKKPDSF